MIRSLVPLLPAFGLAVYFLVALAIYAAKSRRGLPIDREVASRPASRLLGRWLRSYMIWLLGPHERRLVRWGVGPNVITGASLAVAGVAATALAFGRFALGGWLYLAAGICDLLDGRIARATGKVSPSGAFFDSVTDRYAELAIFSGLAIYYRATPVLGLVLAAAVGSFMVSYARARGEALGVDVRVGVMQRPERLFFLGVLLAHSPLWEVFRPSAGPPLFLPAVAALAFLAITTNLTAARRIAYTRARLENRPGRPPERRVHRMWSFLDLS